MEDQEIEDLLKAELQGAVQKGISIDMRYFGIGAGGDQPGVYRKSFCSVCAIGALLLGKPANYGNSWEAVAMDLAHFIGRTATFTDGLIFGTNPDNHQPTREYAIPDMAAGYAVGKRVYDWALQEGIIHD